MAKIKLIASDMDGTLLNDNKQISRENIEAVRMLKEEGIYFVIATGRHDSMIKAYLDELEIEMPVISCNGALVREPFHDRMFSSTPMRKEDALTIAEICRKQDVDYHIYFRNVIYGEHLSGKLVYYNELNMNLPEREQTKLEISENYKDYIMGTNEEIYKVLALTEDNQRQQTVRDQIYEATGIFASQSDFDLIDMMEIGVTKATALENLIRELGISIDETAAIGDQLNDLDMIRFAATGIAVANAVPDVKEAASFVTEKSNNESGVAEAIKRLVQ